MPKRKSKKIGYVRLRRHGRNWQADCVDPRTGRRVRPTIYATDEVDAERQARKMSQAIGDGRFTAAKHSKQDLRVVTAIEKGKIQRLARKEIKAATAGLREKNAALRRTIAEQKRRLAELERANKRLLAQAAQYRRALSKTTDEEVEKARITGAMIRSMRNRLGLSKTSLARLLGVSALTVSTWEKKEGRLTFRGEGTKAAIMDLRKMTKEEVMGGLKAL